MALKIALGVSAGAAGTAGVYKARAMYANRRAEGPSMEAPTRYQRMFGHGTATGRSVLAGDYGYLSGLTQKYLGRVHGPLPEKRSIYQRMFGLSKYGGAKRRTVKRRVVKKRRTVRR
jgi:hypothetical protein